MNKKISVIIPVYNNPEGLYVTLNSLINQQQINFNYEIVVVDNNSTDNTLKVAEEFKKNYHEIIKVEREDETQSSYAARNKGISIADGEIFTFIDADMKVPDSYISKIYSKIVDGECDVLCCDVEITMENSKIFSLYDKMLGFPVQEYTEEMNFCPTCSLVIKKEIIEVSGNFDSRLVSGGDREFGNRVTGNGYKICFLEDIVIKHPARKSSIDFLKKSFRVGRGQRQLFYYYPERYPEKYRNVINPYYYIPCNPVIFPNSLQGIQVWKESPLFTKLGFYFICWLKKLVNQAGYIYQMIKEGRYD